MVGLIFSLLLISAHEIKFPDPYLGYGFAFSPLRETQTDSTTNKYRRKFVNIGLPFRIVNTAVTDPFLPCWVVVPELGWYNDLIQVNIAGGLEGGWPLGYRSATSMIWGSQAGIHYGILRLPNYANEFGNIMSSEDKTSIAMLMSFNSGLRWEINDKFATRFVLNPKFMLGKIAFNSIRTEYFKYFGMTLSFNFQLEFL